MIRELTPEEFEATVADNMRLLDENDDTCAGIPLVDYVERCIGVLEMNIDVDDVEFHYAYMNDQRQICHIGLNFGDENLYLVVVVDVSKQKIMGHTVLDLSKLKTNPDSKR
ncbi:MAG: hypothetical protein JXX14_07265 [Deltaproteobacteria bacterium]|nr:hypothetical protein [Deltaproteobacteria bacterium]